MVSFKDFPLSKCIVWVGNFQTPRLEIKMSSSKARFAGLDCLLTCFFFVGRFFWGGTDWSSIYCMVVVCVRIYIYIDICIYIYIYIYIYIRVYVM